jgi:hypothetical protein
VAGQVSLAITIDIQFPNDHTTDHWTLPDACADGFTAPDDLAREADINGYKSGYHFLCQGFAKTSQTICSSRKTLLNATLPGMSSA